MWPTSRCRGRSLRISYFDGTLGPTFREIRLCLTAGLVGVKGRCEHSAAKPPRRLSSGVKGNRGRAWQTL